MSDTTSELRQAALEVLGIHEEELEYGLPVTIDKAKMDALDALLAAQKERWEAEARIDELKGLPRYKFDRAIAFDGEWLDDRIAALDGVIGEADGLLATPVDAQAQGHEAITDNEEAR